MLGLGRQEMDARELVGPSKAGRKTGMRAMDNSFDAMLLIAVGILIVVVWAGVIVISRLPRIEMLTRGVYEELKRIYDKLESSDRGQANSSALCRSCGKPVEPNVKFCGACGQPAQQMAASM